MIVFISHVAASNCWQITVAQWGHGLKDATRHWFNTYAEAVDAAQQFNPVQIMHASR